MPNIVGILGTDHCGSTLLSILLTQVPGVASVGEIHHAAKVAPGDQLSRLVCRRCGPPCEYFNASALRPYLPVHPDTVLDAMAKLFGVETVACSGKWVGNYNGFVEPRHLDGVVVWKRPEAAVASFLRSGRWHRTFEAADGLAIWKRWYTDILGWVGTGCRRHLVIPYEKLAQKPWECVIRICREFQLNAPIIKPIDEIDWHQAGGNPVAQKSRDVKLDDGWKTELDEKVLRTIRADAQARDIHERLRRCSITI